MTDTSPDDLARRVRALGARFDADILLATRAIYRPVLDLSPAEVEQVDLPYGPHPRHRLDTYRPAGPARALVVYLHGGGFVAGDKNIEGVFNRNVGRWLARHGIAAVLPNYRLAPEHPWPAGAQDLQAVLQWATSHRGELAAPGSPLVVFGQSAGASHAATWLFDDEARAAPAVPVDGVMLVSGYFEPEAPLPDGPRAYFGDDAALHARRGLLAQVRPIDTPVWLGLAELDPGWLAQQTYALAQALTRANGRSPDFNFFRGHNHVSTVQSLGSPQQEAGRELLRFIEARVGEVRGDRPPG